MIPSYSFTIILYRKQGATASDSAENCHFVYFGLLLFVPDAQSDALHSADSRTQGGRSAKLLSSLCASRRKYSPHIRARKALLRACRCGPDRACRSFLYTDYAGTDRRYSGYSDSFCSPLRVLLLSDEIGGNPRNGSMPAQPEIIHMMHHKGNLSRYV